MVEDEPEIVKLIGVLLGGQGVCTLLAYNGQRCRLGSGCEGYVLRSCLTLTPSSLARRSAICSSASKLSCDRYEASRAR